MLGQWFAELAPQCRREVPGQQRDEVWVVERLAGEQVSLEVELHVRHQGGQLWRGKATTVLGQVSEFLWAGHVFAGSV